MKAVVKPLHCSKTKKPYSKEKNNLSRERVTVFTQVCYDEIVTLLLQFVLKGTGNRLPMRNVRYELVKSRLLIKWYATRHVRYYAPRIIKVRTQIILNVIHCFFKCLL